MLDQPLEVFHDAQESLCLESTVSIEILVGGEVSHAWILDSGASLHVTPRIENGFLTIKRQLAQSHWVIRMRVILLALVTFLWCFPMACDLSLRMFATCRA